MPTTISNDQKIEIIYNKGVGVPTSLPGRTISQMPSESARPRIIPGLQIFSQEIPKTAPTDLEDFDPHLSQTVNPSGLTFSRQRSKKYSWIVKYTNLQLSVEQTKSCYNGRINPIGENLLSNAIPFNYDSAKSYDVTVKVYNSKYIDIPQEGSILSWNFDNDAGFLTFYCADATTADTFLDVNPVMTFWRYEGTFGLDGTTGATGSIGATGQIGPTGTFGGLTVGVGGISDINGSTIYPNINTIIFDRESDFSVSEEAPGTAFVSLNSTFK